MCINAVDEVALPETYQQRYSLPLPSYYDYRDADDQKYLMQPGHQHEYKECQVIIMNIKSVIIITIILREAK